ncbi:hypothetical protein DYB26_002571 [Aphanomyces astaci]|uniref:Major facilitator superfamily (MFS) profile domain-containing protein n=2 Tax=Aphanomyces astaci TaxID=112090 RepID=A0A397EDW9_APHAT|nr:hypothetical protein DYB31_004529 [Aphanomyces astaci]RHY95475.1 hypothetical protein DYB26_002571 [Aphanomyces astaci]
MLVPHETHIKPLVLLLASLLNFGGCYCYDNPSALKSQLTQHFSGSNLLYSVYSVPNMVLPLFGGVLTDKFGPRYVLVATTSLMLLAFANGVILSVMRLGTTVNNHVSPKVAQVSSVSTAVWVGAGVCAVSVVASLLLLPIDARAEQQIHDDVLTDQENDQELQVKANLGLRDAATFRHSFQSTAVPPSTTHCPPSPPFAFPLPQLSSTCRATNQFNCSKLPPYVDETAINCDEVGWRDGPFTHSYCTAKFHAQAQAAIPLTFAPLLMAVLAPLFGYFIDHVGCRAVLATATMAALAIAHALLGFTTVTPFVPLALQAMAVCLFLSALWPANFGLAVVPMVVVVEFNAMHKYIPFVHELFVGFSVLGVVIGGVLVGVDVRSGGALHAASMRVYAPPQVRPQLDKVPLLHLPKPVKGYGTSSVAVS